MWLKGDDGKIGELIAWNLQVEHDYALVKLSDGRFESWLTGSIVEVPAPQTSEEVEQNDSASVAGGLGTANKQSTPLICCCGPLKRDLQLRCQRCGGRAPD